LSVHKYLNCFILILYFNIVGYADMLDIYQCLTCSVKPPDDGQRNCPKHVEFLNKNQFGKIGASVGFIRKKFVTMPGHMNVKKNRCVR
jgi:hypothetical protein